MRLVDHFTDLILYARHQVALCELDEVEYEPVRDKIESLIAEAMLSAEKAEFKTSTIDAARFAVVGYIDELILCSKWANKSQWQRNPLQRKYYQTTNMGAEFYDKLNTLNKNGPDQYAREVFSLCLGLGFKGKYFANDHRKNLEEIKSFNLSLLLPGEGQRDIDSAVLFPQAYGEHSLLGKGSFKPRANITPWVIGVPLSLILMAAFAYHIMIESALDNIINLVG